MSILKSALAGLVAGGAIIAISSTAFAVTATPAGPLTIALTCDTGPSGSGTFTVTATGKSSTVSVRCGKSATVSNAAWTAGSTAVIHQTAAPSGALRARDVTITLKATAQTVMIRDFRPASTTAATLAQTGRGLPVVPLGLAFVGLLLIASGGMALMKETRAI